VVAPPVISNALQLVIHCRQRAHPANGVARLVGVVNRAPSSAGTLQAGGAGEQGEPGEGRRGRENVYLCMLGEQFGYAG
jgi:hypothetical protein